MRIFGSGTGPDLTATVLPTLRLRHPAWSALLLGLAIFALLWHLNVPYRQVYVPRVDDVAALADGLLLVPGAQWEHWFTRGHSDLFESYPEWPEQHLTAFARPAFQFLIYLAHFIFGRDWASYLAINYLGVAGVVAVAFAIARTALGLGAGASLLAALLVLVSPPALEYSIWELSFASESLVSLLVGGAFLAVIARRDFLCVVLLLVAVLTKETAVWAPVAAALTVLLRPELGDAFRRRALIAAAMLLPLALWLGLRIAFFGGIGGTYATADYTPLAEFLELTGGKFAHLHHLFVQQHVAVTEEGWALMDRAIRVGTALLVLLLLILWALSSLRAAIDRLGRAARERRWPTAGAALLVTLWAATGLASYFAVALPSSRYAASAVMFAWPALVGEVARRRTAILRLGLAACFVLSLVRTSHLLLESNPRSEQSYDGRFFRTVVAMNTALRQVPEGIGQVYVLSAGSLVRATPDYLRAYLGVPAEIIRVIDISWDCSGKDEAVTVDHDTVEGTVTVNATLPDCASFEFHNANLDSSALVEGRIRRNDSISYELPEAYPVDRKGSLKPALDLGRRMTVHIRPRGRARFIIERGGPGGGLAWFDTP